MLINNIHPFDPSERFPLFSNYRKSYLLLSRTGNCFCDTLSDSETSSLFQFRICNTFKSNADISDFIDEIKDFLSEFLESADDDRREEIRYIIREKSFNFRSNSENFPILEFSDFLNVSHLSFYQLCVIIGRYHGVCSFLDNLEADFENVYFVGNYDKFLADCLNYIKG